MLNPEPFIFADVVAFYSTQRFKQGLGLKAPSDLKSFNPGVIRGTGSVAVLTNAGVTMDVSDNLEFLIKKLDLARVDSAVVADQTGLDALKTFLPPNRVSQYSFESVYSSPIDLIFSSTHKDGTLLQALFQEGMAKIKTDGTYLSILRKYYPGSVINRNVLPKDMR